MDDNAKHAASYQLDQEILDARGIKMSVEEVAGLPTCKYSERVHSLKLRDEDLAFLKGLRRRIKNRLASQNSRRRSVEHLRRLTRELRAVRACRHDALAERRALTATRDAVRDKCGLLRRHLHHALEERSDTTEIPSIELERKESKIKIKTEPIVKSEPSTQECFEKLNIVSKRRVKKEFLINFEDKKEFLDNCPVEKDFLDARKEFLEERKEFLEERKEFLSSCQNKKEFLNNCPGEKNFLDARKEFLEERKEFLSSCQNKKEFLNNCPGEKKFIEGRKEIYKFEDEKIEGNLFECKIGKLVQQSVNHLYNDKKKVFAKTVFIANEKLSSDIKSVVFEKEVNQRRCKEEVKEECQVLNLCVKEGRRKSHGRKQLAPRRIAYFNDCDDGVLDLKIKKEAQ